ncbi:MAG TPA: helix-turn-helix transcriptional regulator [Bacteroidia bacterium]|jgi:transcriptional regulator with XRE-family HTH domain|nr:helix-turn-helix transcriptional regulator [Bacteroidia bacterium]
MHIGTKIKIARITKGLTQEELASKINKTRPLVSHIEQTGKANIYTLKKICSVLSIDIDELHEANEPKIGYNKDEIKRLKDEILLLRELVNSQKEIITELKEKYKRKKH